MNYFGRRNDLYLAGTGAMGAIFSLLGLFYCASRLLLLLVGQLEH